MIVLYGLFNTNQNLSANDLYDAVNASANYARDDSSRMSRGTYVINTKVFQDRLRQYRIKSLSPRKSQSGHNQYMLHIHYFVDNPTTNGYTRGNNKYVRNGGNAQVSNGHTNDTKNGYINAKEFANSHYGGSGYDNHYNTPYYNGTKAPTYLPIRAVQVQATRPVKHNANGSTKRYNNYNSEKIETNTAKSVKDVQNKYVATDIVQSSDAINAQYRYLSKNKAIAVRSQANTDNTKGNIHKDNEFNANDPIKNPVGTKRNIYDLTISSYSNGYTKRGKHGKYGYPRSKDFNKIGGKQLTNVSND